MPQQQQQQQEQQAVQTNISGEKHGCLFCDKLYLYPGALKNHCRLKHNIDTENKHPSFLTRLTTVEEKVEFLTNESESAIDVSVARLAEQQDEEYDLRRTDRLWLHNELLIARDNYFVCDSDTIRAKLNEYMDPPVKIKKIEPVNRKKQNSKILIRFVSREDAKRMFAMFVGNQDVYLTSCVTVETQIRKSILTALLQILNKYNTKSYMHPYNQHRPLIFVKEISRDLYFKKYDFSGAMLKFGHLFKDNQNMLDEARALAVKHNCMYKKEIFVVL